MAKIKSKGADEKAAETSQGAEGEDQGAGTSQDQARANEAQGGMLGVHDAESADREAERREQEAERERIAKNRAEGEAHYRRDFEARQGEAQDSEGGPPQVSSDDIERAREIEARQGGARSAQAGTPAGETDPASVPTLETNVVQRMRGESARNAERGDQPPQEDPDRVPTEGEIAANVDMLYRKGDTAYEHPINRAEARAAVGPPRGEGERLYRILGAHQVGPYAGPARGGPDRAFTLDELWLTDAMVGRLVAKDVIVEA